MNAFRRPHLPCLLLSGLLGGSGLVPAQAFDLRSSPPTTAAATPAQPAAALPHTPRPRAGGQAAAAATPAPCSAANRAGPAARPRPAPVAAGCDDAGGLAAADLGVALPEDTELVDAALPVE